MQDNTTHSSILELTILSAQDIKRKKLWFARLRPFITISAANATEGQKRCKTRVDDSGGVNPTWGDKFWVSLDRVFFYQRYPGIYLQLYTKNLLVGRSQLGWCLIPAADMVDASLPVGYTRFLSYRLRARDGSRGHGVVNVAVKLEGSLGIGQPSRAPVSNVPHLPEMRDNDRLVIGIPVKL